MTSTLAVQDVGSGPAVVLLAGFGLDHRLWDNQVEFLAATHRVVCIDLLGTGNSDKPLTGYSPAEQADLVMGVINGLGIHQFALVGQFLRWHGCVRNRSS